MYHFIKTGACIRQECFEGKNGKEVKNTDRHNDEMLSKKKG